LEVEANFRGLEVEEDYLMVVEVVDSYSLGVEEAKKDLTFQSSVEEVVGDLKNLWY
jgi:hypothetical protein